MADKPAPRPLLGVLLLLYVSAAWGSAFPLMKDLIERLPVEDLLAERYLLAAVTLIAIRPGCLLGLSRHTWINGALLGLMFGAGQAGQAVALDSLPSAVSGFAVGCSVVITPILARVLQKEPVRRRVWAGVGLALAGMAVFTLVRGVEEHRISLLALVVTLVAAGLYSGHTLLLGHLSKSPAGFPAYELTVIQLLTIGTLTGVVAVRDGVSLPSGSNDWLILLHLSVISCALGFLARSNAQKHLAAVPSQILMSSQPLWVAAIAVIWFHEPMGWTMVVGGVLMAGATMFALPAGAVTPARERHRRDLLLLAGRAASVLAERRIRREDPLHLLSGPAPYIARSACANVASCPWNTRSLKGGAEPSLERLIERATRIVHERNRPGPGCCRSITLLGRCLCDLMGESERRHTTGLQRWFRS
ncbi:DMT family transporter [Nonomuraea candida]|uniref:DMT family transporter n=1 Tax=Nonomuraea candida TaxID=359159 RepID=UPI0009FD7445|nr:DMT family transporter [Nonomuraea candida]